MSYILAGALIFTLAVTFCYVVPEIKFDKKRTSIICGNPDDVFPKTPCDSSFRFDAIHISKDAFVVASIMETYCKTKEYFVRYEVARNNLKRLYLSAFPILVPIDALLINEAFFSYENKLIIVIFVVFFLFYFILRWFGFGCWHIAGLEEQQIVRISAETEADLDKVHEIAVSFALVAATFEKIEKKSKDATAVFLALSGLVAGLIL